MNKFTRSLVVLAFSMMGLTGYADIWDGSGDTSWYSESNSEFHIKRAAQLKGLFDLVKAGNSFDGKIIFLEDDLNMAYRDWFPIGGNYFDRITRSKACIQLLIRLHLILFVVMVYLVMLVINLF